MGREDLFDNVSAMYAKPIRSDILPRGALILSLFPVRLHKDQQRQPRQLLKITRKLKLWGELQFISLLTEKKTFCLLGFLLFRIKP
jgi:hypothetical protein